jgi:hypothetical protein
MKNQAKRLPWTRQTVPHGVLDINRGCNIQCRDCYNTRPAFAKTLAEIETELEVLMRRRRVHSISLVGGEVTLHPRLCDIVRLISRRQIHVEIFTNGVLLDAALLDDLRIAGADAVFLHIERNQLRPDLPLMATETQLRQLRTEKTALVAGHGLDAALAVTAYPGQSSEVVDAVRFTVESPHVNHLLVTLWRNVRRISSVEGDVDTGLHGKLDAAAEPQHDTMSNHAMTELMRDQFGFEPFAFLGSNIDPNDPRWLSYLIGVVHDTGGRTTSRAIRQSLFEPAFLRIYRALTGGYPFYQSQNTLRLLLHLVLNGFLGGRLGCNLRLLWQAGRSGSMLSHKRLLFQCPATVDEQGRVIFCADCPDAAVKDGRLVPLCISDCVIPASGVCSPPQIQTREVICASS